MDGFGEANIPEKLKAETSKCIDITLTETDTIWQLNLPGTCVEIDPDNEEEQMRKKDGNSSEV